MIPWRFITIHELSWQFMIIHDNSWQFIWAGESLPLTGAGSATNGATHLALEEMFRRTSNKIEKMLLLTMFHSFADALGQNSPLIFREELSSLGIPTTYYGTVFQKRKIKWGKVSNVLEIKLNNETNRCHFIRHSEMVLKRNLDPLKGKFSVRTIMSQVDGS